MRPSLSLTLAVLLGCVPLPHPMEPPGPVAPAERVSADPAAEVIRAAAQGDAARLRGLLARGGPVDARYKYGSALVAAILGDHAAAAEVLLKAGARGLNEPQGELNRRPLSIAALGGSPALVGLLLRHGADVGAFDPDGSDALGLAVAEGSAEVVRVLLDAGADPNRRSAEGLAAVARAALHGRPEPLRALLDRGGALELRDPAGVTPLLFAAAQGREAAVELLLERGARVNAFDGDGHTPLGAALRLKDVAVRERLAARLRAGGARERAALRPVDAEFLAAAERGDRRAVEAALGRGADLHVRGLPEGGRWIRDALSAAVASPEVVAFLLDRGIDPRMDSGGFTALHAAAQHGVPRSIELLVARGLDPNARSKYGYTPLFMTMNGTPKPANAERLVALGADPNGMDPTGMPLVARARQQRYERIVAVLRAGGAKEPVGEVPGR